jgi:hypothetical protein
MKLNTDSVVTDARPTLASQQCVLFQSTLQDVPEGRTGIQKTEWNNSFSVESARNQEGILYVPEPGTAVMLSIGLFAIIHLVGACQTSHTYKGNAVRTRWDLPT